MLIGKTSAPMLFLTGALIASALIYGCGKSGKNLPVSEETAVADANRIQTITVEAASFYFKPSRVLVKVNQPVRMTLVSHTFIIGHNFSIHAPEAGINVDRDIGHGKTVTIEFTPTKTGEYPFFCNKDGHEGKGMTGTLVVQP